MASLTSLFAQFLAIIRHRPVVSACFALTALLGGSNYFLSLQREAVARRHEIARRNGEFMLHALANRSRIDADILALREAMAQIEANLLDEPSMEVNLGYFYKFERMARVRLVRLNQLASLPPPTGSRFKAVPFSLQVTGSYRNSMSFLRALETGPRILRVRNCSFERTGEGNNDLTVELTIDVLAKA